MDSVVLVGNEDPKLVPFLKKMGYEVTCCDNNTPIADVVENTFPDLILFDSHFDIGAEELISFFRSHARTKEVPVIFIAEDQKLATEVKDASFPRVEVVAAPYRIGSLVSKVATHLRMRKLNGAEEDTATIGEINARLRDLNDCFTKQLKEAREIQQSLVSNKLPNSDAYGIAVSYEPLEDVGGDWFYVQEEEEGKIRVHCADVTGHGLSAAFIGSMTKLAMNAAGPSMPHVQLQEMNKLMALNIPAGKFVTMLSFLYDPATGKVEAASAGHPPALVLRRSKGEVEQLKGEGFAIGFFEEGEYSLESTSLDIGDVIVTYSDAIPESQNMQGECYGYDRLSNLLLKSSPEKKARELLQDILEDFDDFRDDRILKDDVTVVLLKRER